MPVDHPSALRTLTTHPALETQRWVCSALMVVLLSLLSSSAASALAMEFEAIDLPEGPSDPDRWEVRYQIDPLDWASLPEAAGFFVLFPLAEARNLEALAPGPGVDWDVIVLQPDPLLPAQGFYDALALSPNPAMGAGFAVAFDWLGEGRPGPQGFAVYDGSLAIIEGGFTIPEPATALLVGFGLLVCGATGQYRTSHRTSR